jgi:hypothetical protein
LIAAGRLKHLGSESGNELLKLDVDRSADHVLPAKLAKKLSDSAGAQAADQTINPPIEDGFAKINGIAGRGHRHQPRSRLFRRSAMIAAVSSWIDRQGAMPTSASSAPEMCRGGSVFCGGVDAGDRRGI